MKNTHFLLVALPAQGHINPTLQLAKQLILSGARVTFATTVHGLSRIKTRPSLNGLSYASFSDGHDEDNSRTRQPGYMKDLKHIGSQNLKNLLSTLYKDGQEVNFLIYTILVPWVAQVARELHVPSAYFFIQSAAAFSIFYNFYKSDGGLHDNIDNVDLSGSLELPGLPLLKYSEIPDFLLPTSPYFSDLFPVFKEHIENLEKDSNACVLINTFDALEEEAVKPIPDHIKIITIGPLVPFETEKFSSRCELFPSSDRDMYLGWLDSKPDKSVIYVSFGSLAELQKKQRDEVFEGLIQTGHPFLWVLRRQREGEDDDEEKGFKEKVKENGGLIVSWCSQVEVLHHEAIGCFVTHCGWNSTVESMMAGVAVVGCPRFSDQMTNAKMVEDVWGNGVRTVADGEGVVGREEIKRCVEIVMEGGVRSEEIKKSVEKWKHLAIEAVKEDGSSHKNLKRFLEKFV